MAPPEGIEMEEVDPVVFNIAIKVLAEGEEATVQLPPEVMPTERLVSYIYTILKARNLEVKHWTLDEGQQRVLENLSNIELDGQSETEE
jgi:hypothetical protein